MEQPAWLSEHHATDNHGEGPDYGPDQLPSSISPSPLRNSFEPSAVRDITSSPEILHASAGLESAQRRPRFSILKNRHASDPTISRTAKDQAPPVPNGESDSKEPSGRGIFMLTFTAPAIITTAPTDGLNTAQKRQSTLTLPRSNRLPRLSRNLSSKLPGRSLSDQGSETGQKSTRLPSANAPARDSRITFDEPERERGPNAPPAYGDDSNSSLALPVSRLSESSRSDGSLGDHGVYATTTTTHTVSTTTTFFRLPRRKKNKGHLFPLPAKTPAPDLHPPTSTTPHASTSGRSSDSPRRHSPAHITTAAHRPYHTGHDENGISSPLPSLNPVLAPSLRRDSTTSARSGRSSPILAPTTDLDRRGRSSAKGSVRDKTDDESLPTPPLPQSCRTSSSTTGRASLGGLFNLSRLRQNSEPQSYRASNNHPPLPSTPMSTGSKAHSFNLPRESIVAPERLEGDTPAKYLIRLEEAVSRGAVATILSQSKDEFFKNVLRSYMRGFKFFGDPLDMSTRKLLMEVELPKETQQIDRVIQAFANRYHECNPGVYASPDEAYFVAFSILILHTDVFNKNNKNKMQKTDYTKNARGQGVADEVLECFYDNISYTPFIHVEDDIDINGERIVAHKIRKNLFTKQSTDPLGRPSREPVDPYTLILDNRLDQLRPSLKGVMQLEDHYTYVGTAASINLRELHTTFFRSGVLQIVSSRSRPEAFTSPETMANPAEAHPGVVDIKVTKVGILWRKDMKKKKTRSPWQEWGAILTGAQLYFFRNASWVKSLVHQYEHHHKHNLGASPVVFKPPLEQFKPDVLMSTEDAVALLDTMYKKHKNAMVFVRHGGLEETFLADSETEMNDWLAKLNYASAFRTAGVRMRSFVGNNVDSERTRAIRRLNSENSAQSVKADASSDAVHDGGLAHQIQIARRQILTQKIAEADLKLSDAGRQLEVQLRNARHLQILAPIQNKTREHIVLAAGGMAAKIKWTRIEFWRARCHRDILAMDLDDDLNSGDLASAFSPAASTIGREPHDLDSNADFQTPTKAASRAGFSVRPATQPSQTKSYSITNVFDPINTTRSNGKHVAKGSWELPPLSFQPTQSSPMSGSSLDAVQSRRRSLILQASPPVVNDITQVPEIGDVATKLATPTPGIDNNEREVLKEAGIVGTDSPMTIKAKHSETSEPENEREPKAKPSKPDTSEGRSKVRRSLHRTLRESAHVPSHSRSQKGKDSAGSAGGTEENSSVTEREGLARGTGSFTVHGKKASVINFGSEWQSMSPEERLNLRKQAQHDGSKLSVPSAIDDEELSLRSSPRPMARPTSGISTSTTTTRSVPFEEAVEEPQHKEMAKDEMPQ